MARPPAHHRKGQRGPDHLLHQSRRRQHRSVAGSLGSSFQLKHPSDADANPPRSCRTTLPPRSSPAAPCPPPDPPAGELFAQSPYKPTKANPNGGCEAVLDSSRYFVLTVVDATSGQKAYVGMGFPERTESFDFNVALQVRFLWVRRPTCPRRVLIDELPFTARPPNVPRHLQTG